MGEFETFDDVRAGVLGIFLEALPEHPIREVEAAEVEPGRYIVVLAMDTCWLRILLNLGDVELAVGGEGAPLTFADAVGGERVWFPIQPMIARVVNSDEVDGDRIFFMSTTDKLRLFAGWLGLSLEGWSSVNCWCAEAISYIQAVLSPLETDELQ